MLQNLLRSTAIHFDENASGTGGSPAPAAQPASSPSASPAPTPGGSSSPSSSPEPQPGPSSQPDGGQPEPGGGEPSDFVLPHWTGDEDLDNLGNDSVVVPDGQQKPGQQPQPQKPPQQQPAPQAQQQPQPPQPAQQQPQQQPAPGPQDRPLDPTNPADVAQMLIANREAAVQAMASSMYALTPEQVEGLDTNATAMVPELLAQVHVNAVTAAMNRMAEMMPYMMQRHLQAVGRNSENANAFYEANKHLDRNNPQIGQAVAQMARVYRAQNPQATKADMIKAVGLLVSQQLGIAPQAPGPAPQQQQQVAGFVPAATGGSNGQPPPAPAPDPWAGMAGNYDEDK